MASLWKKIDLLEVRPFCLQEGDDCYYAREFVARGGFGASHTNDLIVNFKKAPRYRGTSAWKYKVDAARRFATELSSALPDDISISIIPASKVATDPEYDPRMDMMLEHLCGIRPDVHVQSPFRVRSSSTAVHHGGDRRIATITDNLVWNGFSGNRPDGLVLVDDVITSGAHFKACQRIIERHHSTVSIAGLFWARTIWPSED